MSAPVIPRRAEHPRRNGVARHHRKRPGIMRRRRQCRQILDAAVKIGILRNQTGGAFVHPPPCPPLRGGMKGGGAGVQPPPYFLSLMGGMRGGGVGVHPPPCPPLMGGMRGGGIGVQSPPYSPPLRGGMKGGGVDGGDRDALRHAVGVNDAAVGRRHGVQHRHRFAPRHPAGHQRRLRQAGRAVIHPGVGDLHPVQVAH